MENEKLLLPKPLTDLPEHATPASQGETFRSYKGKFPFPKYVFLGIVFVILLVIVGGAYFLGRNSILKELNPTQPETPPAGPVFQASPTPDPTADWKIFKNNVFIFNYPNAWNVLSQSDKQIVISTERMQNGEGNQPYKQVSKIIINSSPSTSDTTLETLLKSKYLTYGQDLNNLISQSSKKILLGGSNAILVSELPGTATYDGKGLVAIHDKTAYDIQLNGDNSNGNNGDDDAFQTIISTFKFTDSTSSTDTSTWKTYRNDKYGVSINYPSNWHLNDVESGDANSNNVFSIYETVPAGVRVDFIKNFQGDFCDGSVVTDKDIIINHTKAVQFTCDGHPQVIDYKVDKDYYNLLGVFVNDTNAETFEKMLSSFKID